MPPYVNDNRKFSFKFLVKNAIHSHDLTTSLFGVVFNCRRPSLLLCTSLLAMVG